MPITKHVFELPGLKPSNWFSYSDRSSHVALRDGGVLWVAVSRKPLNGTRMDPQDVYAVGESFCLGKRIRELREGLVGGRAVPLAELILDEHGPVQGWGDLEVFFSVHVVSRDIDGVPCNNPVVPYDVAMCKNQIFQRSVRLLGQMAYSIQVISEVPAVRLDS